VLSLICFLALLPPPAACEPPPSATVARRADAGGAKDACRPAPRQDPGAGWGKRSIAPAPPSAFAAAAVARPSWAAECSRVSARTPSGSRLLYLLMSLLC